MHQTGSINAGDRIAVSHLAAGVSRVDNDHPLLFILRFVKL